MTLAYGHGTSFASWEWETIFWHFAMRRLYIQRTLDREHVGVLCNLRLSRHEGYQLAVNVSIKQGIFRVCSACALWN